MSYPDELAAWEAQMAEKYPRSGRRRFRLPGELSADQRRTIRNNAALDNGRHPATGARLRHDGKTCKSCNHLVVNSLAKNYYKCGLVPLTGGPGTDIRVNWPACVRWAENG